jgi:hypothetical protein
VSALDRFHESDGPLRQLAGHMSEVIDELAGRCDLLDRGTGFQRALR